MNITYRKLTESDLEQFIPMRISQLREEGATEDLDLVPALKDYYHRHLADGTFVSWLATEMSPPLPRNRGPVFSMLPCCSSSLTSARHAVYFVFQR